MGHFPRVIAGFMRINPALRSLKDVRILQSPPNVKQSASKRKEVMDLQAELLQGCWFRVNHADLLDELALGTPALLKRPIRRSFVAGGSQNKLRGATDKCAKALRFECKDHGVGIIEERTTAITTYLCSLLVVYVPLSSSHIKQDAWGVHTYAAGLTEAN